MLAPLGNLAVLIASISATARNQRLTRPNLQRRRALQSRESTSGRLLQADFRVPLDHAF